MISFLENIPRLLPTITALLKEIKNQREYLNSTIEIDIKKARNTNDGTLDENDFNKMRNYYGIRVPSGIGESYCTLRGYKMTESERKASTYQGALTGLFDDFFDKTQLPVEQVKEMIDDPFNYNTNTSLEKLFIYFLKTVHQNLSSIDFFNDMFNKVYHAQIDSLKQLKPDINYEEIKRITFNKGGYSLLFYRSAFNNNLAKNEFNATFNLGALMQLCNDIFDVYKDEKQKIRTLVTATDNTDNFRNIFNEQITKTYEMVKTLDYKEKNIKMFLSKFSLFFSRCLVCLDQLERVQKKNNNKFEPGKFSRKELICDMENPINILRTLNHFLHYKQ